MCKKNDKYEVCIKAFCSVASAVINVFGSNSGAMEMTVTGNYVKDLEICSQEKEAVVLPHLPERHFCRQSAVQFVSTGLHQGAVRDDNKFNFAFGYNLFCWCQLDQTS